MHPPQVVVFDVNETLSDMTPMAERFAEIGAPASLARTWFASLLRDGFALTAAGAGERFAVIARGLLRELLTREALNRDLDEAIEAVMAGFMRLEVHPDVPGGVRALSEAGLRLVTLTNGSTQVAEDLLQRAGLRDRFERLMSVEEAGVWKPAAAAYAFAARAYGVPIGEMLLVASHPWDIDGAGRAGMSTAWLNRTGSRYPSYFRPPDVEVSALPELAPRLSVLA